MKKLMMLAALLPLMTKDNNFTWKDFQEVRESSK